MNSKIKDYIAVFLILVVVVGTVVILFYPDKVDYKHSYVELQDKKVTVEENNGKLIQNESTILSKKNQLDSNLEEEQRISLEAAELKRNINEEDFKLNIPSFLISMEQQSYKDNVKLNIDYASITTNYAPGQEPAGGQGLPNTPGMPQVTPPGQDQQATPPAQQGGTDGVTVTTPSDSTSAGFSPEEIANGTIQIEGFNSTIIPLTIEGSYANVRSYIKYLDGIGLIKPSSVVLNSNAEDKIIVGKIVVNVFHGEVLQ